MLLDEQLWIETIVLKYEKVLMRDNFGTHVHITGNVALCLPKWMPRINKYSALKREEVT